MIGRDFIGGQGSPARTNNRSNSVLFETSGKPSINAEAACLARPVCSRSTGVTAAWKRCAGSRIRTTSPTAVPSVRSGTSAVSKITRLCEGAGNYFRRSVLSWSAGLDVARGLLEGFGACERVH